MSSLVTFKKLSNCPAQAQSFPSSKLAEDLTATYSQSSFSKLLIIFKTTSLSITQSEIISHTSVEVFSKFSWLSTSQLSIKLCIFSSTLFFLKKSSNKLLSITYPLGTLNPFLYNFERENPLPPAKKSSSISSKNFIPIISLSSYQI